MIARGLVTAAMCVALLVAGCGPNESEESPQQTSPSPSKTEDLMWIPRGYEYWEEDRSLAFSFTAPPSKGGVCPPGDTCAQFAVASRESCPGGIYVAISVHDSDRRVIGLAYSTTKATKPGEAVPVVIPFSPEGVTGFQISRMRCR
jgi:hypothetical protein